MLALPDMLLYLNSPLHAQILIYELQIKLRNTLYFYFFNSI